jgi:succinoglycan biosynthesis transport protein ExoP
MSDIVEPQESGQLNFDFKAFVFRVISYWKWIALALILFIYIVYHQNIRREFPYTLNSQISIQDDKNPLFTSNTSLIFNYGGISGKVQELVLNLKSRKHHEKVVDSLDLHLNYLKQGRFYKTDIYGAQPFRFKENDSAQQILNTLVKINFTSPTTFNLEINLEDINAVNTQNFITKKVKTVPVKPGFFIRAYRLDENINLPFLSGKFVIRPEYEIKSGDEYFIQFTEFNATVSAFNNTFNVLNSQNSPLLTLVLTNKNKAKIVDYLNTCTFILDRDQLIKKNEFATKTISFIDNQLARVKSQLTTNADSLNDYKKKNKIFDIEQESTTLSGKIEESERST